MIGAIALFAMAQTGWGQRVRDIGTIFDPLTAEDVVVSETKEGVVIGLRWASAYDSGDVEGMKDAMADTLEYSKYHDNFIVRAGVKAEVLSYSKSVVEVLVLDGEYAGRKGFVSSVFFHVKKKRK